MRIAIAGLAALLAGCTWGQSRADDCARLAASGAPREISLLAQESGTRTLRITHNICSSDHARLAGLPGVRHEEVGWCAAVVEAVTASESAVRASAGRQCLAAVERKARYAAWHSSVAGLFVYATPRDYRVTPLVPDRMPPYPRPAPLPVDPDRW